MAVDTNEFDLINPVAVLEKQYKHQISKTIEAYSDTHLVVSEGIQNALDAVAQRASGNAKINITINFDESTVTVEDNGIGFPNDPGLLVIGGTTKGPTQKTMGMVGVGIKVVLYCSKSFEISTNDGSNCFSVSLDNAYQFTDHGFTLPISKTFPKATEPRPEQGTTVKYEFPYADDASKWRLRLFMEEVENYLGEANGFVKTVIESQTKEPAAELIAAYLKRYTYAGDTLGPLGGRQGLRNANIFLTLKSSDPKEQLGNFWAELWGENVEQTCDFGPKYLTVEETVKFTRVKQPPIFDEDLGRGGEQLERTHSGFNVTKYIDLAGYKKLLRNKKGELPDITNYEKKLFPLINCITVTIGRIPQFINYLPAGARRVIAANGVVTAHDIDITSGKNQQYVRCIDIVLDLDAQLNYGKTHLTNSHLVHLARDFVNEAFLRTLNNAAQRYVGTVVTPDDDEDEDIFWTRKELRKPSDVPIVKIPNDENDVIALFISLVTAGYIPNVLVYGLSQQNQYDSRMIIKRDSDPNDLLKKHNERHLRTVEFKIHASAVIRDFESHNKNPNDIHLLVAWDERTASGTRYVFEDIEHSEAYKSSPQKTYPGVTRFIYDSKTGREVQVLLLEAFLEQMKKEIGINPETGEIITAWVDKAGPYIRMGQMRIPLESDEDVSKIKMNRAIQLLANEPK